MNAGVPSSRPASRAEAACVREFLAMLACLAAAVAYTWPMAIHFTTHLGGDPGDPFQTLWSWRWMHDAVTTLRNPFFTDRVFHPHGASLVFQTFDLPTSVLVIPLWHVLPPFGVYNAGVLFAFWLTAYGMYRLAHELTGDRLVGLAAGVLFTATPYHLAHVQGHQHLVSMGWLPLFLLYLHRLLDAPARRVDPAFRDAVLAGLFLALASLASWYHLLFAMVITPVLTVDALARAPRTFARPAFFRAVATAVGAFLLVAGPLLLAIFRARAAEPIAGAHDAVRFSGDLEAFFFPNRAQAWRSWWGERSSRWTGNAAETALYAGYTLMAVAGAAAVRRAGRARTYLVIALLGALLALGPQLHVGGVVRNTPLPYAALLKLLPQLEFMGVPVRLGYMMYLGLIVAAAFGLAHLRSWLRSRPPFRHHAAIAVAAVVIPTALTLVEYTPRRFIETTAAAPAPMLEWGKHPDSFAVLDLSGWYTMMWHATLHRQPITGGNLTRVPLRLQNGYDEHPIITALRNPQRVLEKLAERVDSRIDFLWKLDSPAPGVPANHFASEWTGELEVPEAGEWTFHLTSDDGAVLEIDDTVVLDHGGIHPFVPLSTRVSLDTGRHRLRVRHLEHTGEAGVRLEWEGPNRQREVVPAEALSHRGEPGLQTVFSAEAQSCGFEREAALTALRELNVRYIVAGDGGLDCLQRQLGARESYSGEGVKIYELPR